MRTVADLRALRASVQAWEKDGLRVGFVPTMGNLHAGHYSLVELARQLADRVVVSVFVNPTQFGPNEDYTRYPRTLAEDSAGLVEHQCDLLFAPTLETVYPSGPQHALRIHVPDIGDTLEGEHRPGHFAGVATVVTKFLMMVKPDLAVFGAKDWQQLLVVRRLARELPLPVEIVDGPIVREEDGLALSSRNRYLDAGQRARAPQLHATLEWMRESFAEGHARAAVEGAAVRRLKRVGFVPDYAVVRRAEDLGIPADGERTGLMALVAAKLGETRLIDNMQFDWPRTESNCAVQQNSCSGGIIDRCGSLNAGDHHAANHAQSQNPSCDRDPRGTALRGFDRDRRRPAGRGRNSRVRADPRLERQ